MVTDGEVAEDVALRADRGVHQERRTGRAEAPVDGGELVDHISGLLAEETCQVDLILPEEVEAHAR